MEDLADEGLEGLSQLQDPAFDDDFDLDAIGDGLMAELMQPTLQELQQQQQQEEEVPTTNLFSLGAAAAAAAAEQAREEAEYRALVASLAPQRQQLLSSLSPQPPLPHSQHQRREAYPPSHSNSLPHAAHPPANHQSSPTGTHAGFLVADIRTLEAPAPAEHIPRENDTSGTTPAESGAAAGKLGMPLQPGAESLGASRPSKRPRFRGGSAAAAAAPSASLTPSANGSSHSLTNPTPSEQTVASALAAVAAGSSGGGVGSSGEACKHPVWVFGMCASCGAKKAEHEGAQGAVKGKAAGLLAAPQVRGPSWGENGTSKSEPVQLQTQRLQLNHLSSVLRLFRSVIIYGKGLSSANTIRRCFSATQPGAIVTVFSKWGSRSDPALKTV